MKKFIVYILTSFIITFTLLFLNQMEVIPWNVIIPTYKIPDLKGLNKGTAEIICRVKNISLKISDRAYSDEYPENVIISQDPAGLSKTRIPEVKVVLSKGHPVVYVPDLKGLSLNAATKMLESLSLTLNTVSYVYSDEEINKVISSSPPPGEAVKCNSSVNLALSKGKKLTVVPNITGKSLAAARKLLTDKSLVLGHVKRRTDIERRFGIILKQYPTAGKKVSCGTSITVIINEEEK